MSRRLREWRLSRARAARAEKPAAPPDPTEKFAKQAHELDAVRKSVEDAAAVSAGFWLSYLFVLFYIGIAAGGVTHKDLLLEGPVKLPFLSDVPLPLIAFFFLAPIIFIVSHAYTLIHFVMLAAKVGVYDAELRAHSPSHTSRDRTSQKAKTSSTPRLGGSRPCPPPRTKKFEWRRRSALVFGCRCSTGSSPLKGKKTAR
jgi:hypothetical protein